jgi:potassium efflux system protein
MMLMSGYVLFFSLCYQLLRPNGLAEAHFEMGANIRKRLRQELMWFVPTYLAIIFMVQLHRSAADDLAADGRSIYLLQMLVLMVMAFRCLSITLPSRIGKFQRFLSYSIVLAIPISLAVATVLGYQYSVIELELRWRWTAWLVLGTILLYVLVIRAVNLARRQLKQTQAKALREQKRAERERLGLQEDGALTGDIPETPVLDVDEAQRQSDRLVRAVAVVMFVIVLWSIWGAVLPAFQKLEQVNVWPATPETVSPSAPSTPLSAIPGVAPSPTSSSATNEATISPATGVSQADVVKALLTLLLCYVGLKNIPGLLEVAVLQHINLRQGSSYAITSTVRYLIVVVGLIVAFGYINISWSKVQWLAAAVTVGIGFGLQEIFANFVAGLIILYERPMRIGDIVSVGATSGKVTQIRMRATTITEFNNRDLVMPNKSFITGDFINWTLTNTVLRTEIQVGIAYGSDVHLTRAILERVGQEHPLTLEDPAPQVLFNAFGNSTLDFELRVHVGKVDDLLPVKNDLHYAINDAFKEAGIEIAFPQLDVNLKPQNLEDNKGK